MSRRRLGMVLVGLAAIAALGAGSVTASGASRASASIVDASGSTIGFATFTEDATGRRT